MTQLDLAGLLAELPAPKAGLGEEGRFTALPIPSLEAHRIARSSTGEPSLLLSAAPGPSGERGPPPIRLEHVSVQYDVVCRLHQPGDSTIEAPFTVVRLTTGDAALRGHFVGVLGPLLLKLGSSPTRTDIYGVVEGLIDLFRAIGKPPRTSAQGLWGELLLIACAANAEVLLGSWHATPEDRYDFSRGPERIEVKSAGTRLRKHRFSLDQLQPHTGSRVLIASVLVESAGGGKSLGELIEHVHHRLGSAIDLRHRLDQIVAQTLGESLPHALEMRFDAELAIDTLSLYDASDIPCIDCPLPPEVSDVHFSADLTGIRTIDIESEARLGDLFGAIFPLRTLL